MTLAEDAVIAWACERLIHQSVLYNDAGDFHAMAALFAADGAYSRPTQPDVLIRGRDAILQSYLARPPRYTRHLISTVAITVHDENHASGHSYMTLHVGQPAIADPPQADSTWLIGDSRDTFVREDGVWRFHERRGALAMKVGG